MIFSGRNGRVLRGSSCVVPSEGLGDSGSSRARRIRLGFIWRRAIGDARQIRIAALALRKHQMLDVRRVSRIASHDILERHAAGSTVTATIQFSLTDYS